MLKYKNYILDYDIELWNIIQKEIFRQENNIELIASENYASPRIMQAQGSILTNKYAEGYPNKRYYGGCNYIDEIEELAIKRAKILFDVDYVNVQPHSGSQANFAVYSALLKLGDKVLSMKLNHGGHLTHGSSFNFSGKLYNFLFYETEADGNIDYKKLSNLAKLHRPKMIIGGFSSYSRIIDWAEMRKIADEVEAYLFVDMAHIAGLVIAGIYPNPIIHAHVVTTTTHKTLAGPRGGLILVKNGNKDIYKKLNSAVFPGTQGGPLMHIIAAKAVAFKEALTPKFKIYQKQIVKNAKFMSEIFLLHNFVIVSGFTENHLFILDLTNKNITGKDADLYLSKVNIIVNKNVIPNDPKNSFITSGIRIGTPAITRRGFNENDIKQIAEWMCIILEKNNTNYIINKIKNKVLNMCSKYPIYNKKNIF